MAMVTISQKADCTLGSKAKISASRLTMPPWARSMFTWILFLLSFCSQRGRNPSSPTSSRPRLGPAIQLTTMARMPITIKTQSTLVNQTTCRCLKNTSKACMTPAVRSMPLAGTATAMDRVGGMKMSRMSPLASSMALGYPLPGFFMSPTCTAFISMPA